MEGSVFLRGHIIKLIACVLSCIFIFSGLSLFAFAEEKPSFTLVVTAFPQDRNTTVNLWFNDADGRMWLFLPSQSDTSSLYVQFSGTNSVRVLTNGTATDVFSVGEHSLVSKGRTYSLTVLRSTD